MSEGNGAMVPAGRFAQLAQQDQPQRAIDTSTAAAIAREESIVKAQLFAAMQRPRRPSEAYAQIVRACDDPAFAQGARYVFPRGGATIEGPSVVLARECARLWGNVRFGYHVISDDGEQVTVAGFAHDLETNTLSTSEITFRAKIQRKRDGRTVWIDPDERDRRELVAKNGAIAERNCVLKILPPDLIEDAMTHARTAMESAARQDVRQDPQRARKSLAVAFQDLGVSVAMLETYLGHALEQLNAQEVAQLRTLYRSIRDGQVDRAEVFESLAPSHGPSRGTIDPSQLAASQRPADDSGAADRLPSGAQVASVAGDLTKPQAEGLLTVGNAGPEGVHGRVLKGLEAKGLLAQDLETLTPLGVSVFGLLMKGGDRTDSEQPAAGQEGAQDAPDAPEGGDAQASATEAVPPAAVAQGKPSQQAFLPEGTEACPLHGAARWDREAQACEACEAGE